MVLDVRTNAQRADEQEHGAETKQAEGRFESSVSCIGVVAYYQRHHDHGAR